MIVGDGARPDAISWATRLRLVCETHNALKAAVFRRSSGSYLLYWPRSINGAQTWPHLHSRMTLYTNGSRPLEILTVGQLTKATPAKAKLPLPRAHATLAMN